jgi:hypothetical protein
MSLFLTGNKFDATPIHVDMLKAAQLLSKNTDEQNTKTIPPAQNSLSFSGHLAGIGYTNCPRNIIMHLGEKVSRSLCVERNVKCHGDGSDARSSLNSYAHGLCQSTS